MMEMEATIVTLSNLLQLKFDEKFIRFIEAQKEFLSIPIYQREYKWEKAKIKTLVNNVMQRSKFLGIITTEVSVGQELSIIDGQQRLTTIILLLAQLYNLCSEKGETETQEEIKDLISYKHEGRMHFKLQNDSVGEYLHFIEEKNRIELKINPDNDIYKQTSKFDDAWDIITKELNKIFENNNITINSCKECLLDCKFLLFAQKNSDGQQQGSSEEIYIDINEKSQKLDPEDIFKGHCFAICKTQKQQEKLRTLWCSVKQEFFKLNNIFKGVDMGDFLHFYFLTQEATKSTPQDIKKDLTIKGENVIIYNYNTPTKTIRLLEEIEKYQSNLLVFEENLNKINDNISLIMNDTPQTINNNKEQIDDLRTIIRNIFLCKQNLFKLPLFYLINQNMLRPREEKLTYYQLSNFIYLYYIYMFFFSRLNGSKQRSDLPNRLIYKMGTQEEYFAEFVKVLLDYSEGYILDNKSISNESTCKHLYNIIDCKVSHGSTVDRNISIKQNLFPNDYNKEHLIINQSKTVQWESYGGLQYTFSKDDFSEYIECIDVKNMWTNFIWTNKDFNRDTLSNKDIVNKILLLRGNCTKDNPDICTYAKKHKHIEIVCRHVMNTDGFNKLFDAYKTNASKEDVLECYKVFINNYFSEQSVDNLRNKLKGKLDQVLNSLSKAIK